MRLQREPVPCPSCDEPVGWHVTGTDRWSGRRRYIGTILPRGVELRGWEPLDELDQIVLGVEQLRQFGRPDDSRRLQGRHGYRATRVPAGPQGETFYGEEQIRSSIAACVETGFRFRNAVAFGPFRISCPTCDTEQRVDPPVGHLLGPHAVTS